MKRVKTPQNARNGTETQKGGIGVFNATFETTTMNLKTIKSILMERK